MRKSVNKLPGMASISAEERSKSFSYDLTKEVQGKDGKVVQIKEIFSGDKADD